MTRNRVFTAIGIAFWLVLTGLSSAYMYFLKAPSVVAARPELVELGFWTAIFSGRGAEWIWYHHPLVGLAITATITGLAVFVFWFLGE